MINHLEAVGRPGCNFFEVNKACQYCLYIDQENRILNQFDPKARGARATYDTD